MTQQVLLAFLSFAGTLAGTLGGIVVSNRLTSYRIAELEKKVEKLNSLIERVALVENSVKAAHSRISEIKTK